MPTILGTIVNMIGGAQGDLYDHWTSMEIVHLTNEEDTHMNSKIHEANKATCTVWIC